MAWKNMIKRCITLLLTCFLAITNAQSHDGLMTGEKDLKCIKTEFFDIIYPESSKESAAELYLHADDIYRELCADYGMTPTLRMPVTITGAPETYNAYFSTFTYNHIILYDTTPQESLNVFESTICDTFKHELTHALTINMKNPFWTFMAKVFGDVAIVGDYLNMTTAIKEGASVAAESKGGYGRLNNPYYMHTVRQAKIQGTFPSHADIMGSRDIYPNGNMSYAFGGPFTKWLQDKYGMEKYAEFWHAGINNEAVTYQLVFRKIYGQSISTAWKEFQESLFVPENILQLEGADYVQAVPGTSANGFLYSSITAGKNKIAWLEQKTSTVWMSEKDENGNMKKAKKFLSMFYIESISLSTDGRYLAVSYYTPNAAEADYHIMVYDTENKSHATVKDRSLKNPFIMQTEEGSFLCAIKNHGQSESLVKYRIIEKGNTKSTKIKGLEEYSIYDFPRGDYIYSPVDFGHGRMACIFKKDGKSQIRIFDSDMNYQEIDLSGNNLFVQGLSANDDSTLVFSWARMDTLPRLGRLTVAGDSAILELSGTDISGGIYNPVSFNGKYFYSGNFVDRTRLFMQDQDKADFMQTSVKVSRHMGQEADREQSLSNADKILSDAKKWNTILYGKGITAPFTLIQEYKQTGDTDEIVFLGLTWISSNPWDGNHFAFGGGITPWGNKKGGFMTLIRGGGNSTAFNYQIIPSVLFNKDGFMQATASTTVNAKFYLGNQFYILAQDTSLLFLGHQETNKNGLFINAFGNIDHSSDNIDPAFYLSFKNNFVLMLSNVKQMGTGIYNTGGFSAQLNYNIYSSNYIDEKEGFVKGSFEQSLYPVLSVSIPRLLPLECSNTLTYNLPLKATAFFAPSNSTLLAASFNSVLFSAEIQKGLTFFPLYFNRITLRGEYAFHLDDRNSNVSLFNLYDSINGAQLSYKDYLSFTATISGAINTGIFASASMVQDIGVRFIYYPRDKSSKPYRVSFVTSLNF